MMNQNAAGFQSYFHVWSTKQNLLPRAAQHSGIHTYRDKASGSILDNLDPYRDVKRKYLSARGVPWSLSNNRSEKFRETLQDLEELLDNQCVACTSCRNTQHFQFLLSNAIFVSISISSDSPDIDKIFIDRTLVKKLPDYVSDGIIEENFMILSFIEKLQLLLVNFSVKSNIGDWRTDGDKIALYEPKLSFIDLPDANGFRVKKRNCLCNKEMDLVCVWSSFDNDEAMSWSLSAKDMDRSNVVWLSLTGISGVYTIEVVAHMRTDGDLLDTTFNNAQSHQILTIEQTQSSSHKYLIDLCTYELVGKKVKKIEYATIATKADLVCQARNYIQNKVVLICRNGTLVLWDEYNQKANVAHTSFLPSHISWHPNDAIFLLSNREGDFQIFDIALNCLSLSLVSDSEEVEYLKLSQHFIVPPDLKKVCWTFDSGIGPAPDAISCSDDVILIFDRGPICILRLELGVCTQGVLSPLELVCEYIKYEQLDEAVTLLNSISWNQSPMLCFQCVVLITDYIFKQPFNVDKEKCLENTLGSFYAPVIQLDDDIILQYRDDINRIARRFFHHLLTNRRFEKAFLLAVDIGSKDLFMDIHYYAHDVGDYELAEVSKERAFEINSNEIKDNSVGLELLPDSQSNSDIAELNHHMNNIRITSTPKQDKSLQYEVFDLDTFEFNDSDEDELRNAQVSKHENDIAEQVIKTDGRMRLKSGSVHYAISAKKENIEYVNFGGV